VPTAYENFVGFGQLFNGKTVFCLMMMMVMMMMVVVHLLYERFFFLEKHL
jgi:hypothetical protein